MKKFKFLIKNSLIRKLKSKGFIISQIITSILILAIMIVPTILELNAKEKVLKEYQVLLIDHTTESENIGSYLKSTTKEFYTLEITTKASDYEEDVKNFYVEDKFDVIIHYINSESNQLIDVKDVLYYSKLIDNDNNILLNTVSGTKFALLDDNYSLNIEDVKDPAIDEKPEEPEFNVAVMGVSTMIFTVIFMFIIFSTQSLGAEILEEKSTKAIETIISSVPAETHFYAKILSNIIFTTIQLGIMILTALVGILISNLVLSSSTNLSDIINLESLNINLPIVIIFTIISLVLGLVFYLIYFAFFASFANNNEEYQKTISPLMIILLIIFYGSIILGASNQLNLIRILAYIPFFTPFLLPISLLTGKVLLLEAVIITSVLIFSILLSTRLIVPIYRISILDYSGDKLFSSVKRSFKSRKNN